MKSLFRHFQKHAIENGFTGWADHTQHALGLTFTVFCAAILWMAHGRMRNSATCLASCCVLVFHLTFPFVRVTEYLGIDMIAQLVTHLPDDDRETRPARKLVDLLAHVALHKKRQYLSPSTPASF